MLVRKAMNLNATRISQNATVREAAELVSRTQAADLMVVDDDNTFVGVLSEGDLIRAVLPQFEEIIASGGSFSEAFEIFVDKGKELASGSIEPLIIKNAITLKPKDKILKAASTMISNQIRRLPVLDGGKLVGTISRADVCLAVLKQ